MEFMQISFQQFLENVFDFRLQKHKNVKAQQMSEGTKNHLLSLLPKITQKRPQRCEI